MSATIPALVPRKRSLDILTVPDPCTEPWDEMTKKAEGQRHCDMCMQDVFDLSTMTREAAEALVFESTERVCVRFFRRSDGTVVTSDCTPVRHRALRRVAGGALKTGARVAAGCLAFLAALGVARAADIDVFGWLRSNDMAKSLLDDSSMAIGGEPLVHWEEDLAVEEPYEPSE